MSFNQGGDLPLTFPKIPPTVGTTDYYESLGEKRRIKFNQVWDQARDCSIVELFQRRRILYTKECYLEQKRQEAKEKRKNFDGQWEELNQKEKAFKQSFKKFNKFVKENQEKRERAEKKILDEVALQRKRTADTDEMKRDFEYTTEIKNLMEKRIKEYRLYEDYLQAVVKSTSGFKNVNEVLFRYEALIEAKNRLFEKQEHDLSALEFARSNMVKLIEEKTLVLVGLQNQVANLQERYDLAKEKALLWETTVTKVQDISTIKLAELQQVKITCYNIYLQMCSRKCIEATINQNDFEAQLMFIKKTLYELQLIMRKLQRQKVTPKK